VGKDETVNRTRAVWFALAFVAGVRLLSAQAAQPIRVTVAAAEKEGAAFPRTSAPRVLPTSFSGRPSSGTADRRCVTPSSAELLMAPLSVRAGDFVIGGELGGAARLVAGRPGKIWWAPLHDPFEFSAKLLVRGARIGSADTMRFVQSDYAWPAKRPKTESFFASGLLIPAPGVWLLVATAGNDWGCIILTVGSHAT
jgi:hypothetical protein